MRLLNMANVINSKMKQYAAGNWGHPRRDGKKAANAFYKGVPVEEIAALAEDIVNEEAGIEAPKKRMLRRKKRAKRIYQSPWETCPFCGKELPVDQKKIDAAKAAGSRIYWVNDRVKECVCGAREVNCCPSCKHKTWHNPDTMVYKHPYMGCGFEGSRLQHG